MKSKLLFLYASAMAAFMDFGVGTLITSIVAYNFGTILPWPYLFIGGLLALAPDMDMVPSVVWGKSPSFDHRQTIFHRPLFLILLISLIAWLLGGQMWLIISLLCITYHFLHDTNFTSNTYGIAWFWPFSNKYWNLNGSFTAKPGMEHHFWLKNFWLRPTTLSVREISTGLICLTIAGIFMEVPYLLLLIPILLLIFGTSLVWFIKYN